MNALVSTIDIRPQKLLNKASLLGISDRVYTIDAFLEKVTAENPELADYKVLSVRKYLFGNLDYRHTSFTKLYIAESQSVDPLC